MKKILNEWKNFLKENSEIENENILNKVRDIFFGAYNVWEPEYKLLHSGEFNNYYKQLVDTANQKFKDPERNEKVTGGAGIGISLYWSDNPNHGAGSADAVAFLINRKLEILESRLSEEEKNILKDGMMKSIIDSVRQDRSNQMYPTTLAVSVGVINGVQVNDAYMTTPEGVRRFVIPILQSAGYYDKVVDTPVPEPPRKTKRKKYDPQMSLADMKAMMDKFGR